MYNFPGKSELPKFILPVKNNWLIRYILFCCFRSGNTKNCRDQSRLTFSSRGFAARFRARGYMPRALVLHRDPARRPGITYCCSHCSILVLSLFGIKLNHSVKEIAWLCILSVFGWKNCVAAEGSATWKNNGEDNYLLNDSSGTRLFFSRAFFGVTVKD